MLKCSACAAGYLILERGKLRCDWCRTINEGCCEGEKPVSGKPTTIYIAGPMRYVKWFNFPAFDTARDYLASHGVSVLSPADNDRAKGLDPTVLGGQWDWSETPPGFDLSKTLAHCAEQVSACDGLLMLKGWQNSRGAKWEFDLALMLGKPVFFTPQDAVHFARGRECQPTVCT